MRRFADKTVLVTGASRGIGLAVAERFAQEGARVYACARDVSTIPATAGIYAFEVDVTDVDDVRGVVQEASANGGLDICVANAGSALVEEFLDTDPAMWEQVLRTNLLSAMLTFQAAAQQMVAVGNGGRLLANASVAGVRGEPRSAGYSASKGGLIALVESLAIDLAPHRITVNAVAPGEIETKLHADAMVAVASYEGRSPQAVKEGIVRDAIPAQRMGTPEEIAAAFAFLASPEASFITGVTVPVDGGALLK